MANQESRLSIVIDSKTAEQNIKRLRTALKNVGKESIDAGAGIEVLNDAIKPLSKLESALGRASKAISEFAKDSKTSAKEANTLNNALKKIGKESVNAGVGIELMADAAKPLKDIDKYFDNAALSSKKLAKATDEAGRNVVNFSNNTKTLDSIARGTARETENLANKAKKAGDAVDKLGGDSSKAKAGVKELGDEAEKTKSRIKRLQDSVKGFNDSVSGLRNAALVGGAALGGMLYKSVGAAQKFETAMAEINKTVDFKSPDGLSKMRSELEALTQEIPLPFEELAAVTATGGQLGIAEKDLVMFTRTMAKMGVAFDMPAEQAADSMAKIANVFSIPIPEIDKLGDAINTLSNNTPAKASEIINALQRVGGVAKTFGLSEDATAGLTGAFIAMGKPAEAAASAVNGMLTQFSTLGNATKTQMKGFNKLGLDIDEFSQLVKTKPKQAIETYLEAVNKLPQAERVGTNAMIIGKEFGDDVTMLAGSVDVLRNNWELLGETANTTKDYMGSMQKEFEAMSGTSAAQLQMLKSSMDNVFAAIGTALLPALNDIVDAIKPVVLEFSNWAKENPELVTKIVAISGVITGVILAISGIGLVISGVMSAFTGLAAIAGVVATAIGAISLPVLAVVGAIGALVAAGVYLYRNWDEAKAKATEVWDGIKAKISEVWEGITTTITEKMNTVKDFMAGIWDGIKLKVTEVFNGMPEPVHEAVANIKEAFGLLGDIWNILKVSSGVAFEFVKNTASDAVSWIKSQWEPIKGFFAELWNRLVSVAKPVWGVIKAVFSAGFNALKSIASTALSAMGANVSTGWNVIKSVFTTGITVIASVFNAGFDLVKNIFTTTFNVIKALVQGDMQGVANAIKTGMSNAWKIVKLGVINITVAFAGLGVKLFKIGTDAIQGLINGLKSKLANLKNTAHELAGTAINALKSVAGFDTHSPSKKTIKVGQDVGQGLANGIKSKTKVVKTEAQKLAEQAMSSIKSSITSIGISTEFEKWRIDLSDATNELSKLDEISKKLLLSKAVDLDVAQASNDFKKQNTELRNQIELLGVKDDYQKELLKIQQSHNQMLSQYNVLLEAGYEGAYNKVVAEANVTKELREQLALTQARQSANDAFYNLKDSMQEDSPMGKLVAEFEQRKEIIRAANEFEVGKAQERTDALLAIERAYADKKRDLIMATYSEGFGIASDLTKKFFGENSRIHRAMFAMEKGIALARIFLNNKVALAQAWASAPFPANLGAVAKVGIETGAIAAAVQAISPVVGQAHDGIMSVPKSGTWNLEKGERVLPQHTAKALDRKLDSSNDGNNVNITVNVDAKGNASMDAQGANNMSKQLANSIKAVVQDQLRREKRQGGMLSA